MVRLALVLCLASSVAWSAAKKKKPAVPPVDETAAVRKAFDAQQDQVANCVVTHAPAGKWSLTVKVQATLNSAGQMMSLKLGLNPEPATPGPTRDCIDKVLRAAAYPKTAAPLINVDRDWTFTMG